MDWTWLGMIGTSVVSYPMRSQANSSGHTPELGQARMTYEIEQIGPPKLPVESAILYRIRGIRVDREGRRIR
jgi:hypothetical protein